MRAQLVGRAQMPEVETVPVRVIGMAAADPAALTRRCHQMHLSRKL